MRIRTFVTYVLLLDFLDLVHSRPRCWKCEASCCYCSRQNLREVPTSPSNLVRELDLSFNSLEVINDSDFISYGGLKSLLMSDNKIRTIQEDAFVPLSNLEKLDLSSNELDALSAGWFKTLLSLKYLNVLGNKYATLGQCGPFQALKNLTTLYFGGPHLQSVGKPDFTGLSGLQELTFDGTNIQDYSKGSLRQIGPVGHVTLGLNGLFDRNQSLVTVILSDVVHPNTSLTLIDTEFTTSHRMILLKAALQGGATSLTFKNVTMTPDACYLLLLLIEYSNVTMLDLTDITFIYRLSLMWFMPEMKHLEVVVIKNVTVPAFYSFPALTFLKPMMKALKSLSLINSMFFAIPCDMSKRLVKLEYFDLSGNILSDGALSQMMCLGDGVLLNLRTLNLSRNHLLSINSFLFTKLDKLQNIDMSRNDLRTIPLTCQWPQNLRFLNLSSSYLTKVTSCLPKSLHVLDLSNNGLTVFSVRLPLLTELYMSGNKISSLPEGVLYPRLTSLYIQNNNLHTFSSNDLDDYVSLKSLKAASSTYVCSCDFVAFMRSVEGKHQVQLGDESELYICDSPYVLRGTRAVDARLSVFQCHAALAVPLLCSAILAVLLLAAFLCHKFHVLWFMKMTWAWVRAKRKPKLARAELRYDAFVSYSEMDSGWVEAHLVPELEQAEPRLRLCLHKRDFVPGGWILDNIMDAIEKSYKTLFVLSQHFVRSEWCKYELDYTHFRLFDHNDDAGVLILLEPIDKNAIPKKFCKLRRFMNSRTYLEWPDDDDQIPRFWQSLRAAINRPLTDTGSTDPFNSDEQMNVL